MNVDDALARLDWAESQLQDAMRRLFEWRDNSVRWEYYADEKLAWSEWIMHVESPPPLDISLAYGDFLANARSTLDMIAWQIYKQENPRGSGRIYFPIVEPGKSWANQKKIPNASPAHLSLLEQAQDRPPVNLLYMLNHFANSQKHKRLLVMLMSPDTEVSFPAPAVPDGHSFVVDIFRDPVAMTVGVRAPMVTYWLESDDTQTVVDRPKGFSFDPPERPLRPLALNDGEAMITLAHLPLQLDMVRRIVLSFASD